MTGVPMVDAVVIWSGVLAVVAGGATVVWRATRGLRRAGRHVEDFIADWRGTAPRPGVAGQTGVMERLGGIEQQGTATAEQLAAVERRLARVEHELHPNGGASLRDAVDRVDARTRALDPDT